MKQKLILNLICFTIAVIMVGSLIKMVYLLGRENGMDAGISSTLDTIQKVCIQQSKSDTSYTDLVIINPDTVHIYLSRKTILPK